MTYEQIEKSLMESRPMKFLTDLHSQMIMTRGHQQWEGETVQDVLKQSFIKYLQSEVDWLKTQFQDEHPVDCIDGVTPVETYGYEETYNQAIKNQITHLQAQIKEIESIKN